ncbi:MAG: 50S ribosome-binding GTPase [Paucimonas sp.]|nr:50S ribosome-binding GTPase [Paucimonas sp.]
MDRAPHIEALEAEYQQLLKQRNSESPAKPRITAWGLVKAGKSSLLNMLSGHACDEHFKTDVVRMTRTNQALELDDYVLVDTPGLGIDDEDSQEALKGLDETDVVLFVHAPPGELDEEEVALLDRLRDTFGNDVGERVVLVLSLLDKFQDGDMAQIREKIERQALIHLGTVPECFVVSSTRYRSGVEKDKEGLRTKSGVPALDTHLRHLAKGIRHSLETLRQKRLAQRAQALCARIDAAIAEDVALIERVAQPYAQKAEAFVDLVAIARKTFKTHTDEIQKAKEKLASL